MNENQKHQFAFDRIFADDSLATARRYLSADNIVKIIKHVEAAMWRPIETLGGGEKDYVLARTADGRVMQMRASMLARNLKGPTPDHLSFPAIQWMPAPISATLKPEFPMSDAIQQERDRLARILEVEALKRSPFTDNGVTQRVTYAIAARIVRRGRALIDREKLENLMRGLEDIEDDEAPTK